MPWVLFVRDAVYPSSMGEYWYCPAKITNMQLFGSAETKETESGYVYHEEATGKIIKKLGPLKKVKVETVYDVMKLSYVNIRQALTTCRILANSEDTTTFRSVLPEMKIAGKPDKADCKNGREPILMDIKTTKKLPGEPWVDNRVQLGAYMLGVERLGFRQTYGIIRYVLREDSSRSVEFKVYLDGYLRDEVKRTCEEVRQILQGGEPRPTTNPNKCKACPYNTVCQWSLVEYN